MREFSAEHQAGRWLNYCAETFFLAPLYINITFLISIEHHREIKLYFYVGSYVHIRNSAAFFTSFKDVR